MIELQEMRKQEPDSTLLDLGTPEFIAKRLTTYIFSNLGHNWFDEIKTVTRGKFIYIYGWHNMGPNFHIFMEHLVKLYFEFIGYTLLPNSKFLEVAQSIAKEFDYRSVKRKFYKFSVKLGPKSQKI